MATATVGSVKIDASEKRLPAELIEMISTKCEWGPDKKVHMHVGILIDSITVESPPSAEKAAAEETADAWAAARACGGFMREMARAVPAW